MDCRFCGEKQEFQRANLFKHVTINDYGKDVAFIDMPHYYCYNCSEMSFEPVKGVLLKLLDFAFTYDYNVVVFTENDDVYREGCE